MSEEADINHFLNVIIAIDIITNDWLELQVLLYLGKM
jgi:hypothetical protein